MKPGPAAQEAMARSVSGAGPREGDVLVERDGRRPVYTVRRVPAPSQLRFKSRQAALQVGSAFGRTHGVDLWTSDDGVWRPIETFRGHGD
jgi:hypothetical protein